MQGACFLTIFKFLIPPLAHRAILIAGTLAMLSRGLEQFKDKRVLLLQGPVGPFFKRLAADLRGAGAQVHKVNFNAGDWLFYPRGAIAYRGTMDE